MEESSEQLSNSSSNSLVLEILKSRFESLVEEKMKNVDSQIKYLALVVWIKQTKATIEEKKKAFDQIKTISIADQFKLMVDKLQLPKACNPVDKLQLLKTYNPVSITNSVKNISERISMNYPQKSMDLDSISIYIKTEGLVKLLGMRAALASSTQYLRDEVLGDYCNIFDGVFIVKIPFVKKQLVTKKLFERGIQFCPSQAEDKRIATERVWVSTIKIIQIFRQVSIDVVRIIGHGLKQYHYSHFCWQQFLWYDPTNRFDFARTIECQHFNLYDSYLDCDAEVYPLFGTDSGTLKLEKGQNKIKVYNTFIHALKNRAKLKFRLSKTMTYGQMRRIIQKIQRYMKLMKYGLPTSTRIQITIHQKAGVKFSGILMQADLALCQVQNNLTPSRIFTKNQYIKQIQQFGVKAVQKRYFNGKDNHVVSQSALKKLKYLYKLIGISEHPKKGRYTAQSPENQKNMIKTKIIMKRDKKGRFQKNND